MSNLSIRQRRDEVAGWIARLETDIAREGDGLGLYERIMAGCNLRYWIIERDALDAALQGRAVQLTEADQGD